jgi:hypothetical protein
MQLPFHTMKIQMAGWIQGLFKILKEGCGVSNNLKTLFKSPSFENASFTLNSDTLTIKYKIAILKLYACH